MYFVVMSGVCVMCLLMYVLVFCSLFVFFIVFDCFIIIVRSFFEFFVSNIVSKFFVFNFCF